MNKLDEIELMIDTASNLAEKEGNMCLKRMIFVEGKKAQALKEQKLFIELVLKENALDEYLNYSFVTHQNTMNCITFTLLKCIFNYIEVLNKTIWDWRYGINQVLKEPYRQESIDLYQLILKEVKDFIEIRQKSDFKISRLVIHSQIKIIRDYFLITGQTETSFSYLNFSHLDYILEMVEDCTEDSMINILINIPYLQIQFQSIYQHKISNEQLQQFRIFRKVQLPSNIDIFVIFVQNKQWKQFNYSNFSYEIVLKSFKSTALGIVDKNNKVQAKKNKFEEQKQEIPRNIFSIEVFISNEADKIQNVQIKTGNPKQKPYQIHNKFGCLLKFFTDKLRNTLLYFCVFEKLVSPLMTFNSKQILYDLWDNLQQAQSPSYLYPFLEETFPHYEQQILKNKISIETFKNMILGDHNQSDFIYE